MYTPLQTPIPMMDGVDLDISQTRADLLPDKYDRRCISVALAIRRLSSWHYKRSMSEGNVCRLSPKLLGFLVHKTADQAYTCTCTVMLCFM